MSLKSFVRILWFAIWAALAIYFALTIWLGILGLTYPYQLDYGEGIVLWFARELAHGHSIYERASLASSNYPPLAMILSALLMPIFGNGYLTGRLLNFTAAILIAGMIYRIVTTETRKPRIGALAALFFIGSPYIYHWIPLFRADLIGLAFSFGGIYFAWEYGQTTEAKRRTIYFWLFASCFLLALYTKQTLVAAPAAAFLALFRQSKRKAILFALALGVTGGAIYLAIDLATRGGFTFGLIDSNATVFMPDQLFALLGSFAITFAIMIGLAVWEWVCRVRALKWTHLERRDSSSNAVSPFQTGRFGVLEAYAITSTLTLVFAGRVGAWENYFFEMIAVACVFASFKLKVLSEKPNYQLLVPFLLLLQLALYTRDHDPRDASNLFAQDYPANQQLAALLSRTNGTIISEDMGALVTSGKPVSYYTFQYSSLARADKWDQSWELKGLRDGMFPLVILESGTREDVDHYRRFTREFVSALDRYYAKTQTFGKYEIYTPAPLAQLQSADFGDTISMVGWSAGTSNFQLPTSKLQISIVWQAERGMPRRYTAFVHLETANGDKVAQDDREPRGGAYPTTHWAPGEMVREDYNLNVPTNLAAGKYFLRIGWYSAESVERLAVPGSADDSVMITIFEVR